MTIYNIKALYSRIESFLCSLPYRKYLPSPCIFLMHNTKLSINLQKLVYDDSIMQAEAIDITCFHRHPCQSL